MGQGGSTPALPAQWGNINRRQQQPKGRGPPPSGTTGKYRQRFPSSSGARFEDGVRGAAGNITGAGTCTGAEGCASCVGFLQLPSQSPTGGQLKQQAAVSQPWRLEGQDQGAGRAHFSRGRSPWLIEGHLFPVSLHIVLPVCMSLSVSRCPFP